MKKYIYSLMMFVLAATALSSCSVDEGTQPGSDSNPVVTIYQFKAQDPYDQDADVRIRVAANSKTAEAYIFAESTTEKTKRMASVGEDGYMDYVISKGVKLDKISGNSDQDYTVTGINGTYTITVVAKNGNQKSSAETSFTGVLWNNIAKGTYTFSANAAKIFGASVQTSLQVNASSPTSYRFKNLFGVGAHLNFTLTDKKGTDKQGKEFLRLSIPAQATPKPYGNDGVISVRDVATWQSNENYLDNRLYDDHKVVLWLQYYNGNNNLGYGYDAFVPNP